MGGQVGIVTAGATAVLSIAIVPTDAANINTRADAAKSVRFIWRLHAAGCAAMKVFYNRFVHWFAFSLEHSNFRK